MAELLIRSKIGDGPMRYQRGDIVEVYEDGRCTEAPSPNSGNVIVTVPGVTKAKLERLLSPHNDPATEGLLDERGMPKPPVMLARRRFRLRVDDVPLAIRNQLATSRWVTLTAAQVVGYIRDKVTNIDLTAF